MTYHPVLAHLSSGPLSTIYGDFQMHVFHDGIEEAIVLTRGEVQGAENILCRIQSECVSSHVFFGTICDCREQMSASLESMRLEEKGIAIFLRQEGRGNGAAAHVGTLDLRRSGRTQSEAYRLCGFPEDARTYNMAAKVLSTYQVTSVRLISGNSSKRKALENHNIKVKLVYYSGNIIQLGEVLENTITAIQESRQIPPISKEGTRVLILGDLNVDYLIGRIEGGVVANKPDPVVGGTGFNAALAYKEEGLVPILFGKVGDDQNGRLVKESLRAQDFISLLGIHQTKGTGTCNIVFFEDNQRWLEQEKDNANDYDLKNIAQAITLSQLTEDDFIFVVAHPFFRSTLDHCRRLFTLLHQTKAQIILDIVPHTLYKTITLDKLNNAIGDRVLAIIGEFPTLMRFIGTNPLHEEPTDEDCKRILDRFSTETIICRYGVGNISKQSIIRKIRDTYEWIERGSDTGYTETPDKEKRGFGDRLTASFIKRTRKR